MALPKHKDGLKRELTGYQIFFITMSGVIGGGVFFNDGAALAYAGPLGVIISVVVVSIVAICFMECLTELIQLFPVPTAIYHYIETFLDRDLAWVASIGYWYTYAVTFPLQTSTAADNSKYWDMPATLRSILFYFGIPFVLLIMNLLPVYIYGWTETIGGALKLSLALGVIILLFVLTGSNFVNDSNAIDDNFPNQNRFLTDGVAQCAAIPLIAFSFLAVDAVVVTAREAKPDALKWPSMAVSWTAAVVYLFIAISETLNVRWSNTALPQPDNGMIASIDQVPQQSSAMAIIAVQEAIRRGARGLNNMPGFLNACFIFSKISSANTVLYLASRMLHGMTHRMSLKLDPESWPAPLFKGLSQVPIGWRSPAPAVLASAVAFCWLPFLRLVNVPGVEEFIYVMANSGNVSLLIVWAALCAAYLRFYFWTRRFAKVLKGTVYSRSDKEYPLSLLSWLQPLPAIVGLLGSIVVVLFGAAGWWSSHREARASASEVAGAFGAPVVMFTLWLLLKARRIRKLLKDGDPWRDAFVQRPSNWSKFKILLGDLDSLKLSDDVGNIAPNHLGADRSEANGDASSHQDSEETGSEERQAGGCK